MCFVYYAPTDDLINVDVQSISLNLSSNSRTGSNAHFLDQYNFFKEYIQHMLVNSMKQQQQIQASKLLTFDLDVVPWLSTILLVTFYHAWISNEKGFSEINLFIWKKICVDQGLQSIHKSPYTLVFITPET